MSNFQWTGFLPVLKTLYALCIIALSLYGLNSLTLSILYLMNRRKKNRQVPAEPPAEWPLVTIQLPLYNEADIIERLLNSVVHQDYPIDRFEIQVLDDSTDETTEIARVLVDRYRALGYQISLLHRTDRSGYKAGALAEGLKVARGEFLAIFDADFSPPPNWLKTVMAEFNQPHIGCLQTRWGHINTRYNLLTNAQALGLDGHFIVEQGARYNANLFMGFNGSGGVWRKQAIESAGGWASDTLTEDLDLSYRAQLKGWRIKYLPEVVVPAELPAQIDAFKVQQYRWAKGSVQTMRKLGGRIARSDAPWIQRLFGLVHMTMYLPFPFMVMTLLLTLPMALYATDFLSRFPWTVLASLGPPLLYSLSRTTHLPRFIDRLVRLPVLTVLGIGISLNTSFAVLTGLYQKGGVFNRTPKFAITSKRDSWRGSKYVLPRNAVVWGELLLAGYAIFSIIMLLDKPIGKAVIPGLLLYAVGYSFVAGLSLVQSWQQNRSSKKEPARSTADEPAVVSRT